MGNKRGKHQLRFLKGSFIKIIISEIFIFIFVLFFFVLGIIIRPSSKQY